MFLAQFWVFIGSKQSYLDWIIFWGMYLNFQFVVIKCNFFFIDKNRSIIFIMAGQTLLTNLVGFICVFSMGFLRIQNLVTCIMFGASRFILFYTNLASIALISQIRFYVAWKSSRAEVYNKKYLQCMVLFIYVFLWIFGSIIFPILGYFGEYQTTVSAPFEPRGSIFH